MVGAEAWANITANTPRPEAGAVTGGWRSDLAWAAQYGGTFLQWKSSHHATIGSAYARLEDDTIIATTGDTGIRTFLADGPKLVDSDAYKRAADAVDMGEKTRGFVYVDVDGALPLAERAGGSLPPDAKDAVAAIDSFILQSSGDGDVTKVSGFVRLND